MSDSGGTWALGILLFRRGLVWVRGLGRVRTLRECVWPLVGSVEGLSRVPVERGTGPAWPLASSRGLSGDCTIARLSPPPGLPTRAAGKN